MHERDEKCIDRILAGEAILASEKVRFDVNIRNVLGKGRLFCTKTRLLLYARTPMGMQVTIVWYKEVEMLTSGKKKGAPYVQLLGQGSRILVLFKSKEARDGVKKLCSMQIAR